MSFVVLDHSPDLNLNFTLRGRRFGTLILVKNTQFTPRSPSLFITSSIPSTLSYPQLLKSFTSVPANRGNGGVLMELDRSFRTNRKSSPLHENGSPSVDEELELENSIFSPDTHWPTIRDVETIETVEDKSTTALDSPDSNSSLLDRFKSTYKSCISHGQRLDKSVHVSFRSPQMYSPISPVDKKKTLKLPWKLHTQRFGKMKSIWGTFTPMEDTWDNSIIV
ncbi:hypothetical protein CAAN1_09S01200 [[Candida] anglica]|uniref:Uncharacterized protein n=1 Tax=[Candida] anglica TaxID=148631 RepID=A0ABP0EAQ0_9ASCO